MQQNLKALLERLLINEIDICTAITEAGVAKLREALKDLHPWHRTKPAAKLSFMEHPVDIHGTNNIYLKTDLGVLDILSQIPPVGDFEAIKNRSIEISLYGHRCKVISLEDLIRVKEAMNRPKDQQAAKELRLIRTKS